jgi:hypothetical protein
MNQEVPQRNTDRESRNGINSTLFVLITSLCTHKHTSHDSAHVVDGDRLA